MFSLVSSPSRFFLWGKSRTAFVECCTVSSQWQNSSKLGAPGEDGREIEGVTDLTFGEYVRLLENEKRWKKLRVEIDRVEFISRLNRIRGIRNDVMHFDPDGLEEADLDILREFAQFLKRLREAGAI